MKNRSTDPKPTADVEPALLTPDEARKLYRAAAADLRAAADKLEELMCRTLSPGEDPEHPDSARERFIYYGAAPKTVDYVFSTAWSESIGGNDSFEELRSLATRMERAAEITAEQLLAEWVEELPKAVAEAWTPEREGLVPELWAEQREVFIAQLVAAASLPATEHQEGTP